MHFVTYDQDVWGIDFPREIDNRLEGTSMLPFGERSAHGYYLSTVIMRDKKRALLNLRKGIIQKNDRPETQSCRCHLEPKTIGIHHGKRREDYPRELI